MLVSAGTHETLPRHVACADRLTRPSQEPREGSLVTCYHPNFLNEETEAQRAKATCPRSLSWQKTETGFKPRKPGVRAPTLNHDSTLMHPGDKAPPC